MNVHLERMIVPQSQIRHVITPPAPLSVLAMQAGSLTTRRRFVTMLMNVLSEQTTAQIMPHVTILLAPSSVYATLDTTETARNARTKTNVTSLMLAVQKKIVLTRMAPSLVLASLDTISPPELARISTSAQRQMCVIQTLVATIPISHSIALVTTDIQATVPLAQT
jgi:hypothetical protein